MNPNCDRKKILFVINTMGRAGAERCLLTLLKSLDRKKYDISLFSVVNRGELFLQVPEGVRLLNENPCPKSVQDSEAKKELSGMILKEGLRGGYFFREAGYLRTVFLYQRCRGEFDFKKIFWKLCADHAPIFDETFDLAVAYIQGAATCYVMDHVNAQKKIAFLHNEFMDSGYCPQLERKNYERADAVYCVSESIRNHFAEVYPDLAFKMDVFYNLMDTEEILRMAHNYPNDETLLPRKKGQTVLLTAARLVPAKALERAVEALSLVRKAGLDVCWYVLGEGPEREMLERNVEEKGLKDFFFLLGAKENPYPYLAQCDIYVQTSRYEGCCTTITEAFILGKPVIATDCSGNREQLNRFDTGILTGQTGKDLAEGIIRLVSNPDLVKDLVNRIRLEQLEPSDSLEKIYRFVNQ